MDGSANFNRHAGPDRVLFLPGGLLDRGEVPSYLNGTLAGECVLLLSSSPQVATRCYVKLSVNLQVLAAMGTTLWVWAKTRRKWRSTVHMSSYTPAGPCLLLPGSSYLRAFRYCDEDKMMFPYLPALYQLN